MEFYMKLPRNRREFALFVAIVSVLSVNIIAPLITCFEMGFRLATWRQTLEVLPFIWLVVILLVLLTHEPASKLTAKVIGKGDRFAAQMIVNCLINVVMMSIILTVVATWIGMRQFSLMPIEQFFFKWPRNFSISFFVELCIAQPLARFDLYKKYLLCDRK
ncbi:hypothetical protein [Enterococcus diestrammenae]|uniref:hypothetical protein n=1 Tax=Enterococcus diestrammenae TaxID=1155073 RepID=UPI0022E398C6|nr:hypothetical protein [Enterococcus diestrammenae]